MKLALFDSRPQWPKSKEATTKDSSLLGVFIPQQITNYIALRCLSKQQSKSMFSRHLITAWYQEQVKTEPLEYYVQHIGEALISNFIETNSILETTGGTLVSFDSFLGHVSFKLSKKGIDQSTISQIIETLKTKWKEQQKAQ